MRLIVLWIIGLAISGVLGSCQKPASVSQNPTLIYHGVTTHRWSNLITPISGQADAIKAEVDTYEAAVGRTVAWVGFAHEWKTDDRSFPSDVAISIKNRGATPLIFLNLRSTDEGADSVYSLEAIVKGQFDLDLAAWADGAKNFGSELMVNWGWEMNLDSNSWNGTYNGGEKEGPRRFKEAYRHIIELMRNRGATNIRWGFHINIPASPAAAWNFFENYYPGDDMIDCTGVSLYGAQAPTEASLIPFVSNFDAEYSRLIAMAPNKPVFVYEFATTSINSGGNQAIWADDALEAILSGRWPKIRGFAWWNDYWNWTSDDYPANNTEMRVEVSAGLTSVFKARISGSNVGDRPPLFSP